MKASLKIEAIGDSHYQYMRLWKNILNDGCPGLGDFLGIPNPKYWAAAIVGRDPVYRYARQFLKPKKGYRKGNGVGSRGVYLYYLLESGYVYEVSQPVTWQRVRRYFCTVDDDGNIVEVSREYVDQWVNDHSVSMY